MIELTIKKADEGKRLDKYLGAFFKAAPSSFYYKQLRKKNITLNGKKADGSEKLSEGDTLQLFMADDTISKFRGNVTGAAQSLAAEGLRAYRSLKNIRVIYEDEDYVIIEKGAAILSQKARQGDLSANEWLVGYLCDTQKTDTVSLAMFRPSVCNRLDFNTSGLLICAATGRGAAVMGSLLKERTLHKFYRTYVEGQVDKPLNVRGYLSKNELTNKVNISSEPFDGGEYIETAYNPIEYDSKKDMTLLEVLLITGKPHQIRAHLAFLGHPVAGDYKYGDRSLCEKRKQQYGITCQLLHAFRLEFPVDERLNGLSGRTIISDMPRWFDI